MAAFASITVQGLSALNKFADAATYSSILTALATNGASSATYGGAFSMADKDEKYLILVENSNSTADADPETCTIKAGNGLQGNGDLTVSLANGKYSFVEIESGRFKNTSENETLKALSSATAADQIAAKGKVFITGGSHIKVAVFKLA